MGDRANVFVKNGIHEDKPYGVFLYSHWDGAELGSVVHHVLSRKLRWNDDSYLARMIFSEMIKNHIDSEIGYGISSCLGDNQYPIIIVDCDNQTIALSRENNFPKPYKIWTFEQLVELPNDTLKKAMMKG